MTLNNLSCSWVWPSKTRKSPGALVRIRYAMLRYFCLPTIRTFFKELHLLSYPSSSKMSIYVYPHIFEYIQVQTFYCTTSFPRSDLICTRLSVKTTCDGSLAASKTRLFSEGNLIAFKARLVSRIKSLLIFNIIWSVIIVLKYQSIRSSTYVPYRVQAWGGE